MPSVAKRTHKLSINKLKGISGLSEIRFEDKDLTGIFGPNGIGKSTILHALAAAYNCPKGCQSAHYRDFFPKLADDAWNGAQFTIDHTYWTGAVTAQGTVNYRKGTSNTMWQPLINKRPVRHVVYIGIKSCLPDLERFPSHNLSGATKTPRTNTVDETVRDAAGIILDCEYDEIADITAPYHPKRVYRSLTRRGATAVSYPSVTMGAGEQRLFKILYVVEQMRDYGLLLIDELDLMLHGSALKELIDHLVERCRTKHLQIVFTSHREELLSLKDKINIRHLHPQGEQHHCYANTDPDSLHRLTGNRVRPLEVFVEDDVAEAIVSQVAGELGISRHVKIFRFGAAENCFQILAGLMVKGEDCRNSLFLLDGDVFPLQPERDACINRAHTGNGAAADAVREKMSQLIKDFALPTGRKPEEHLHQLICNQNADAMSAADKEIALAAAAIVNPADKHDFIDKIVETLGDNRAAQLAKIVPLSAKDPAWTPYTQPLRDWLINKKAELALP